MKQYSNNTLIRWEQQDVVEMNGYVNNDKEWKYSIQSGWNRNICTDIEKHKGECWMLYKGVFFIRPSLKKAKELAQYIESNGKIPDREVGIIPQQWVNFNTLSKAIFGKNYYNPEIECDVNVARLHC